MSAVRSKICGITRIEDALAAVEAGADAIGFVFYAKSPRAVTAEQARAIIAQLPPFITTVGLFVDVSRCELTEILEVVPLDLLQFHGAETPADCDGYHRPWIKALRVRPGDDLEAACRAYHKASGILLDAYVAGIPGGTGEAFDWALIPAHLSKPIILAGGLSADNVAQAIRRVRPYAVDVSGGVEAQKGIKDHGKVEAFMAAVRGA
ncbi:phosphoribosylanthranilate isomerase [Pseudomonas abieticivorans]|uniref:phosphoribosylanthranilate isomerase n=1 Tax=Pseudomonas abieticivorans TaxID=2931382 RepID=UPI0020C0A690|nr:phosphoribosylanthranilate isomerase [Pseudomonas sp. PIA16]